MEKIKVNAIVELAGKPEAHIKETMDKLVNILKGNEKIKILKQEIAPINKVQVPISKVSDKHIEIFSTYVDLQIEFPNFDELMQFLYVFMPSSIEIVEPEKVSIKQKDIENSLNDLLARLHEHSKLVMEFQALRSALGKDKN